MSKTLLCINNQNTKKNEKDLYLMNDKKQQQEENSNHTLIYM